MSDRTLAAASTHEDYRGQVFIFESVIPGLELDII